MFASFPTKAQTQFSEMYDRFCDWCCIIYIVSTERALLRFPRIAAYAWGSGHHGYSKKMVVIFEAWIHYPQKFVDAQLLIIQEKHICNLATPSYNETWNTGLEQRGLMDTVCQAVGCVSAAELNWASQVCIVLCEDYITIIISETEQKSFNDVRKWNAL